MAAIKKQSLVDQIYQRLRENIITMQLPLGSHLNVNELQSQMGVSCTPIREAINRLQQEGLVVYENNVGARVLMFGRSKSWPPPFRSRRSVWRSGRGTGSGWRWRSGSRSGAMSRR